MRNYLIAERYASGLSKAVEDTSALEAVLASLRELSDLYQSEAGLRSILGNPSIELDKRAKVLEDVLAAGQFHDAVARLAQVLLNRGRLSLLPDIVEVFSRIVDQRLNRVTAVVTTSAPLTPEQQQRIDDVLTRYSGKSVYLQCEVDPEVVGGVVARMGGVVIDGSLRTQLERIQQTLMAEEI